MDQLSFSGSVFNWVADLAHSFYYRRFTDVYSPYTLKREKAAKGFRSSESIVGRASRASISLLLHPSSVRESCPPPPTCRPQAHTSASRTRIRTTRRG